MATRLQLRTLIFLLCAALAAAWSASSVAEVPEVTGEHWTTSSEEMKKAYLIGIANVIQVETAYYAANPPSEGQNFIPRFAKGLQGQTLDSVRESLNRWYAANPDKLKRPVIETIWFEIVVPELQKTK